ncbi:hypothetical protein PIB30_036182 [Stylosanthes scabra]|uniref:Uncharacterized protein n=1 Tax=Stylosanthes scabra TaxID=79078 RepID=A0ABU6RDI7_9FABA|nr:hypothetical protein [Stylosanthes scabra]
MASLVPLSHPPRCQSLGAGATEPEEDEDDAPLVCRGRKVPCRRGCGGPIKTSGCTIGHGVAARMMKCQKVPTVACAIPKETRYEPSE